MKECWLEYYPKIAKDELSALIEIDKKLKPTGQSSKQEGVFTIHEVRPYN